MRSQTVVTCALWLATLTGCPPDWVKEEGFLDRAAAKDTEEGLRLPECTDEVRAELCEGEKKDSFKCKQVCGG
jgi:hypothetical protein